MLNRREFLAGVGSFAGLSFIQPYERILAARPRFDANPFSLGVASGDPNSSGVVLWTRLAPDPLNGGGMDPHAVEVRWQVAADEGMRKIVKQGKAQAVPELAHSVHVEVNGLEPARTYWYQFECGGVTSPVGRTKTAPRTGDHPEKMSFAFASCSNWNTGHWVAYRHMSEQDLDIVFHLGDYIYESTIGNNVFRKDEIPAAVRPEPMTLEQYRLRYALYKSDPDLQAAHAAFPFAVTWDDHEVENNYADDRDQNGSEPAEFLKRRAAAYQAYYEHMPLRRPQMNHGPDLQLYRRFGYGDLVSFSILDTRQYRSDQAHNDRGGPHDAEMNDPSRVFMGPKQEWWLQDGLKDKHARWNVIPQQVWMTQVARENGTFATDTWDGYPAERGRLMKFLHESQVRNPIVLTGDSHTNLIADLKLDFDDPKSPVVGAELAGTSISSNGTSAAQAPMWQQRVAAQPHLKWYEGTKRGYVACTLDRTQCHADVYAVEDIRDRNSKVNVAASFRIEDGRPGVVKV